jgi:hypothetical protein
MAETAAASDPTTINNQMKTYSPVLLLAGIFILSSGCINLSFGGGKTRTPPAPPAQIIAPAPVLSPPEAAMIAEIDAAARLHFENSRQEALGNVAQRAGLAPVAQVHLVNVTYRCLTFESAKLAVLRKLIANPGLSDAARHAILSQLDNLTFEASKQNILRELNQRSVTS